MKKRNPGYYGTKNLFPRGLPAASLTRTVTDRNVTHRLHEFAKKYIEEVRAEDLSVKEVGATYMTDAKSIMYYLVLTNRHDHRNDRWVLVQSYLSPVLQSIETA